MHNYALINIYINDEFDDCFLSNEEMACFAPSLVIFFDEW